MQKENVVDCLDPFLQHCKKFELKITPQRCAIYKKLKLAKNHPTAYEMYQVVKREFPNVSFDTVNRTLLTFAKIGLVDVIPTKGGPRRFDADMEKHHHFHCLGCGEILDFFSDQFDNIEIPDQFESEFTVFSKSIFMNGLCKKCRKNKGFKDRMVAIENK